MIHRLVNVAKELAPDFEKRAPQWDRTRSYCWENVSQLVDAGIMGMSIPREYGGQGASYLDVAMVVEQIAKVCTLTARVVVEGNMGGISAVMGYGTAQQKAFCAEHVLAGDKPAICITEPEAGSAATEMQTTAHKQGGKYILNGTKHWITGGGVSKLHLVFARVLDEAGSLQGIGGFILFADPTAEGVPKGFTVVGREHTMGLCGMPEAELRFDNIEIDEKWLIKPPSGLKHGFADLMNAYNSQRVGAATVALGIAEGAYENALDYAQMREQFGRPIAEFQGLQWMLADMSTGLAAAQTMVYRAAASAETQQGGFPEMLIAAQAKILASETAIKVTSDALQVFGAAGYSRNLPMERMYRDARMFTIGGGTAQVLRNLVASRILERKLPQTRDGYSKLAVQ